MLLILNFSIRILDPLVVLISAMFFFYLPNVTWKLEQFGKPAGLLLASAINRGNGPLLALSSWLFLFKVLSCVLYIIIVATLGSQPCGGWHIGR